MAEVLRSEFYPWLATVIEATEDGAIAVTHTEDVTDFIEANKAEALAVGRGIGRNKDEWRKVASIPLTIWHELVKQGIVTADGCRVIDEAKFRRWLNDSDNRFLRTCEGKV